MSRWIERLLKSKNISSYAQDAQHWNTCAVGEIQADFPKVVLVQPDELDPAPKDKRLLTLGIEFGSAVENNERRKALRIYRAIHRRVERLLTK